MEVMSALCLVIFNSIRHPIFYSKYSSTNDGGNIHVLLTSTLSNHLSNIDISMIVIDIMHSLLLPPHYSATTSEVVDEKKEKKRKENRLSFFLTHHPHRFHVSDHDNNNSNKTNHNNKEEEKEKLEKEEKRIDEQLKYFSYCMISPSLALGKLLMTSWNNYLLNSDFILHITPVILLLGMDITSYKEWVLSASPNNPTHSAHHRHHHHNHHHDDHEKQPTSSDHRPLNNITHDKTLRKLLNHLQPCYEENLNIFSQSGGCELVMQSIVKYKKHASVVFLLCPIIRMLLTIQSNDNNYLRFYEMNVTDVLTELLKIYQLDSNSGSSSSSMSNNTPHSNHTNNNDIMIRELCQTIFMTLQSSSYQFDYLNSYGNLGLCDLLATLLAKQLSLPTTSSSTPPTLPLPPAMTEGSSGSSSSGMTEKQDHHHLFFSRREKVSLTECQQLELRIIETLCTVEETKQRFQQTAIAQTLSNARHHHHYGVHSHTDHCIVS